MANLRILVNEKLKKDFFKKSKKDFSSPSEALRWLMREYVMGRIKPSGKSQQ